MNLYGIKNLSGHQTFDTFSMAVITQNKYFDSQRIRCISIQFQWHSMHFRLPFDTLLSQNFEM